MKNPPSLKLVTVVVVILFVTLALASFLFMKKNESKRALQKEDVFLESERKNGFFGKILKIDKNGDYVTMIVDATVLDKEKIEKGDGKKEGKIPTKRLAFTVSTWVATSFDGKTQDELKTGDIAYFESMEDPSKNDKLIASRVKIKK